MRPNKINIKLFVAVYGENKDDVRKLEDIIKKLSNTNTCSMPPSGNNMKYGEILLLDVLNDINEPNYAPISEVDWYIQEASKFIVENDLEFSWADYSEIRVSSLFPVCISELTPNKNNELSDSFSISPDLKVIRELSRRGIGIEYSNEIVVVVE